MKPVIARAALLLGASLWLSTAAADNSALGDLAIIGLKGKAKTVSIFDDAGNFKSEQSVDEFLHGRDLAKTPIAVQERNERGLLLIQQEGGAVWVDEMDVRLNHEKTSIITCVSNVHAKAKDTETAAAMGLNSCK